MDEKARLRSAPRGLTRGQVGELLGIPESEVSRMDERLLHPVRTADRRWLYEPSEVRALLDRSPGRSGGGVIVTGETTAEVFELFEAGKTLPQVVIATKQTAATISHLRTEYDRMAGSMVLPAETVSELRRMMGIQFQAHTIVRVVGEALTRMFREGREDATDFGEVLDFRTGTMRRILRDRGQSGRVAIGVEGAGENRAPEVTQAQPSAAPVPENSPAGPGRPSGKDGSSG